jgi:hypothetical protein
VTAQIPPRSEYTPAAVAACEKALRTVITKIGPWGAQLVLIGGMAPKYLVGEVRDDMSAHIGTTDLDVVVGVALETEDDAAYRTLQKNLSESRFSPAIDPDTMNELTFRWERQVDGVNVALEFFCPVGSGTPGKLRRNPGEGVGSKISAVRTRGAELAAEDFVTVNLSGDTLDRGGIREAVPVKVANILPFLVLKSLALQERDKDKDAYDVVWILNAYQRGPETVAIAARRSKVAARPEVTEAIEDLRNAFKSPDHAGPARYARFQAEDSSDLEEESRLRRFAHGTVTLFLKAWDSFEGAAAR